MAIEAGRRSPRKRLPVEDLGRLREEHRIITGIHEVYGRIYPDFRDSDADSINFAGSRRKSCLFSMPGSPETVVVPT